MSLFSSDIESFVVFQSDSIDKNVVNGLSMGSVAEIIHTSIGIVRRYTFLICMSIFSAEIVLRLEIKQSEWVCIVHGEYVMCCTMCDVGVCDKCVQCWMCVMYVYYVLFICNVCVTGPAE